MLQSVRIVLFLTMITQEKDQNLHMKDSIGHMMKKADVYLLYFEGASSVEYAKIAEIDGNVILNIGNFTGTKVSK